MRDSYSKLITQPANARHASVTNISTTQIARFTVIPLTQLWHRATAVHRDKAREHMVKDPKTERDIRIGMFEQRKRELIKQGMSEEEADDRASAEVRRQIRQS